MNATKQIEKLEAKNERLTAANGRLKDKIASIKTKARERREAKASAKGAAKPKARRKPARSSQTAAAAA